MEKNIINRNYGIDLLRIVSMFLVVVLHVLGQGGILSTSEGFNYYISWILEILAYPAVNCYGLISGFVGYSDEEKNYNYFKYTNFWLQGVSYSFGITFISFLLRPELIGKRALLYSLFPVSTKHYWYLTAYTGLFFIVPWINKLIRSCSKKEAENLMLTIFVIFSVFTTFSKYFSDIFLLNYGYSFIWLLLLYILGACIKKSEFLDKFKIKTIYLSIIFCLLITWINVIYISSGFFDNILLSYISPTILIIAFCYLSLFEKINVGYKLIKIIKFISSSVFGVYLLHTQAVVWEYFIKDRFNFISKSPIFLLILEVIFFSILIFIICIVVEKIRNYIFKRFDIENRIVVMLNYLIKKVASW